MKKLSLLILVFSLLATGSLSHLYAQGVTSGTVTYEQITSYDFANLFNVDMSAGGRFADYIATLPTESKAFQKLLFNENEALYEEDKEANKTQPQALEGALAHLNAMTPPRIILQKVYWDLKTKETIRQIEFMTRPFHVVGPASEYSWKLTGRQVTIQGYICGAAEMVKDNNTITAWFAHQIPVSIGPAEYGGLPGLILAVDVNGETVYVARSVELTAPAEGSILKPEEGGKLTQAELDALIVEKTKEWEETRGSMRAPHGDR